MVASTQVGLHAQMYKSAMTGMELLIPLMMSHPDLGGLYYVPEQGVFIFYTPANPDLGKDTELRLMALEQESEYAEIIQYAADRCKQWHGVA